jgi:hypothetical protein
VPRPSWLGELLTWNPTVEVRGGGGGASSGTGGGGGGVQLGGDVGATSADMAGTASVPINIYANGFSDLQVEVLAQQVARILGRR